MSSSSGNAQSQGGDNQQDRAQIVYCHECQDEWRYTGEHSLICPSCRSDFVEIVENEAHDPSRPQMPLFGDMDEDSDGEEGGHAARFASSFVITGPGGFQFARTFGTLPGPPVPGASRPSTGGNRASAEGGEAGGHGAPGAPQVQEMNLVSMLQGLLTNIMGEAAADRARQSASGNPPPVTGDHAPPDPRTPRPEGASGEDRGGPNSAGGPPPVEVAELTAFLNTLFGPGAGGAHGFPLPLFQGIIPVPGARGDYVYSNAQLDRVISELMEQHQGNAPPPAPAEVLNNLPKIKVDAQRVMEGEDCTVCKEELNIEEEVAQLPCKHVYHEECIKRWLETRDTCPICRAPTAPEHRQGGEHNNNGGAGQNQATATASADGTAVPGQQQQQQQGGGGGLSGWLFGNH